MDIILEFCLEKLHSSQDTKKEKLNLGEKITQDLLQKKGLYDYLTIIEPFKDGFKAILKK